MKIINWFQIPVLQMDRAVKFYGDVLGVSFHRMENEEGKHAFFAFDTLESLRTGGELVESPQAKPSEEGILIYLNAADGVDAVLARAGAAGGSVVLPKMAIGENGVIAIIRDSEGNKIGLHSM